MEKENEYKGSPFLNIGPHIQKEYFEKPLNPNYNGKEPPSRQIQCNPYILSDKAPFEVKDASIWYKDTIFITNEGYQIRIIEYKNKNEVLVEFLSSGFRTICKMSNIKRGLVKYPYHPNKYSAYYGATKPLKISELESLAYQTWIDIFKRTSRDYQEANPSYIGVRITDEWYNFQYFKDWFLYNISLLNPNRNLYRYQIDKDLYQWETLSEYKIYGPNTCCILPKLINTTLVAQYHGPLPPGVRYKGNKFSSEIEKYGNWFYVGTFETKEEAFLAYKEAKESYLRELADIFYNDNAITEKTKEMLYRIDLQYDNSKKLYKIF